METEKETEMETEIETETVEVETKEEKEKEKIPPRKISIVSALWELAIAIIYYICTIIDDVTRKYLGKPVITTVRVKYDYYLSQWNKNYVIPFNKRKEAVWLVAKAYYFFFLSKILGLIEKNTPSFAKVLISRLKVWRFYAEQQVKVLSQSAQNLIDEWKHAGENIVDDLKHKGERLQQRGGKIIEEFKSKNDELRKKGETLVNEMQKIPAIATKSKLYIVQLIVQVINVVDSITSWVIGKPGLISRFIRFYAQTKDRLMHNKMEYQTYCLNTIAFCRSKSITELTTILIQNALKIVDGLVKKYVTKSGLSLIGIKFSSVPAN